MGLEILEEFRPITPIRTVPASSRTFKKLKEPCDLEITKEEEEEEEEEEECHTPTSPSQMLSTPLVCPPAPKKPKLLVPQRRKNKNNNNAVAPISKRFFQVTHDDLASVFVLRTPN